jgi:DNA gyrase subunit B
MRGLYVHIAESPLYEITCKGKTYFAFNEPEKAAVLDQLGTSAKPVIQRSKGLGENEPDMMWLTTMNPETRRLVKVTPESPQRTAEVFDLLLGDNLTGRKEFITEQGAKYIELADIS